MTDYSANYSWLASKYNQVLQTHQELGKELREAGPIDDKTAHLIQLAAAAAIRSEGSVHSHTKRALQAGATADEVYHSLILLTSTIGFPNVAAALSWAKDVIES
jgi:AhpD family alkylhydroperoxidase